LLHIRLEEIAPMLEFLRKIKQTTTHVQMIGKMKNNCLVQISLGALPNSYNSFIQGVISHDEMTIFEKNSLRKLLEKIEVSN
jgi:hypothetical protein